ncbi:MAG: hypothetical protein GVY32_07545 [Gammaproteobacteria bacterium]|jgi:hypothetical protein|nr:hypothetical protein [Gammaproteobacteria bacterium]
MIDLQRNLLTALLAAGIAVLVLAAGGLALLLGRPDVDEIEPEGRTTLDEVQVDVPRTGLEDFESYSAIIERPVFFSDRQLPVVEVAENDAEPESPEPEEVEEISELKASVAGIVITPDMKLAMVADETAGETMVLREGMSLEGEQAAWRLEAIQPRQVRFVSVDGRQADLELAVNTSGLAAPARARPQQQQPQEQPDAADQQQGEEGAQARQEASEEARARAEEIRRRVAERRAQLRAEAERRARQRQEQQDNDG